MPAPLCVHELLFDSANDGFTSATIEASSPSREASLFANFNGAAIRGSSTDRIQIPIGTRIDRQAFAIVFWLDPDNASNGAGQAANGRLFESRVDASNLIDGYYNKAGTLWTLRRRAGGSDGTLATVSGTFTAGAARALLFQGTATTLQIAVASGGVGGAITSVSNSNNPGALPTNIDLGRDVAGSNYFDAVYGAVAFFNRALTAEEWGWLASLTRPPMFGEAVPRGVMTALWYGKDQVFYDNAADQLTRDCRELAWTRGRAFGTQATARSGPGKFSARLRNQDGRYSPSNPASPLAGLLLPGRTLQYRSADATQHYDRWRGRLAASPAPSYDGAGVYTAQIEAEGPLAELAQAQEIDVANQADILTGDAIDLVLDAAGWSATLRSLAAGQLDMTVWYAAEQSPLEALRSIEASEFGFIREDGAGRIVFEDRHTRLKGAYLTSQMTLSDTVGATHPVGNLVENDPLDEVFNDIRVEIKGYAAALPEAVLWQHAGDPPVISPGHALTFLATYEPPDTPQASRVEAWTTPSMVGGDIVAAGFGSGDLDVTVVKYAKSMSIMLTNITDDGIHGPPRDAELTTLQARGTAVNFADKTVVQVQNAASQAKYGIRRYAAAGEWLPNANEAEYYADGIAHRHGEPVPIITRSSNARRSATHLTELLERDVSDRITVDADASPFGLTGDFYIESISEKVQLGGGSHEITFVASSAAGDDDWWRIGISGLGIDNALGF